MLARIKKNFSLFFVLGLFFLVQMFENTFSQVYCFWIANESDQTFSMVRIRETGTSSFGQDILPDRLIEPYQHYWIRTGTSNGSVYDIEISQIDGKPLKFSWIGKNGIDYTKPFITLDISPLNTLMITNDDYGNVTWDFTNEDIYGFGNPCNP